MTDIKQNLIIEKNEYDAQSQSQLDNNNITNSSTETSSTNTTSTSHNYKMKKYKSLFNSGTKAIGITGTKKMMNSLDEFIENEAKTENMTWNKLSKTDKIDKLRGFVNIYVSEKQLDSSEKDLLVQFFSNCLDNKKLQRVKDVIYDAKTGIIKDIPGLLYNKNNKHFTLKNLDKRVSTLKSLHKGSSTTSTVLEDIDSVSK